MKKIVLGGGCFWCIEAIFSDIKGVVSAKSGYCGGDENSANYKDVCSGETLHVEVVEITYDEKILSLKNILEIFFKIHDPTTLNRQGNDIGLQYSSIIFYNNEDEKSIIEELIVGEQKNYSSKIVTKVELAHKFYIAEDYHQNYFKINPNQGYCQAVIAPKVEKFKKSL
ncbi:MAG: peptide-methionine (S)-S-oxide reductase MsrA [Campylobacterota bacterium]|nr:peptide-methionine (S)-S-oxide reductase MsrA [Campylobacterota bacterium]